MYSNITEEEIKDLIGDYSEEGKKTTASGIKSAGESIGDGARFGKFSFLQTQKIYFFAKSEEELVPE